MEIPKYIEKILEKIDGAGFEVAVVGGAVRDMLSKKRVEDWDLATNAKPEEVLKLFPDAFYNNRFGTVGIPGDGETVEITTYRSEDAYSDTRHPDKVIWGKTLEEDLERRDFTVNAMAIRYTSRKLSSRIVDPFEGQGDLKKRVIRTVGEPDLRFGEDALRLLRAARFATTLDFEIEEKTLMAIGSNVKLLSKISGERIREELFGIITSENCDVGIFLCRDIGLLSQFLPELAECFSVEQKSPKRHHIFDVGTHCVMSMKFCPSKNVLVKFATLLHDIGKVKTADIKEGVRTFYNHEVVGARIAKEICERLHLSKDQREKVYRLVRWHQFSVNEDQTDSALRRFIKNIGVENIEDMMDLRVGDRLGGGLQEAESWRLKLFRKRLVEVMKKPFTVTDLKVSGNDVMEILGINPGPEVGKVLNKLFEEVLEDASLNKREYLIDRIKKVN